LVVGLLGAAGVVAAGCSKDDKNTDTAPSATVAPTAPLASATASVSAAPSASATVAVADDDDTPTEEDFDDEADDITAANVDSELSKIEKDLK
jgi:pyocin large subunit-like protein